MICVVVEFVIHLRSLVKQNKKQLTNSHVKQNKKQLTNSLVKQNEKTSD